MRVCCPVAYEGALPELDAKQIAMLCKALAHPARVQLTRYLACHGPCYFGDLTAVAALAPSTISQHLTILKQAGLLLANAEEQRVVYRVNPARLAQLKQLLGAL